MHRVGVSLLITRWPTKHELLEELGKFGVHHVYRFAKPLPSPIQVEGTGRAEVLRWSDEERILKLSEVTRDTRLVLAMSPYSKWRAYQEDKELVLQSRDIGGSPLVVVAGAKNGELRLTYEDLLAEKAAGIAGLLAFLICAVGVVVSPRPIVWLLRETTLRRVYAGLSVVTVGLLLALPILASVAGRRGQRAEWLHGELQDAAIVDVLHQRLPDSLSHHPSLYCVQPYSRSPGWDCTESKLAPVLAAADARGERVPSCLLIGVPPDGRTVVSYTLLGAPDFLLGRLDNTGQGSGVTGTLNFDDKHSPAVLLPGRQFRANVPAGAGRAVITLENASRSASRICLEAVGVSGGAPANKQER
jgi:hypothetical protein